MTPERQKWWVSLPTEEKRVRYVIAYYKEDIKFAKAVLKVNRETYQAKVRMQEHKQAIKALCKQIAMRPIWEGHDEQDYIYCPTCHTVVACVDCLDWERPKHCEECGQKLRWK